VRNLSPLWLKSASTSAIVASVLAVVLLAFGLISGAKFVDDLAQQREERLVANGLQVRSEAIRSCTIGETTWDEAYKNVAIRYDRKWTQYNIARWFNDNCGLERVYIFNARGELIDQFADGVASRSAPPPDTAKLAAWLIGNLRQAERQRGDLRVETLAGRVVSPIIKSAIGVSGGTPSIAVASLVQPDLSSADGLRGRLNVMGAAPVVVGVGSINQAYLQWMTGNYLLKGLRLEVGPTIRGQGADEAVAAVRDYQGRPIGALMWTYNRVAGELGLNTSPFYIVLVAVLLGGALTVVVIDRRQLRKVREAAAAAEEASLVKSRFIANLSHEIRTPMSGVLGILRLLQQRPHDPDSARLINEAVSCGELLTRILNDILDFARLEEGRFELEPGPCAVDQVVRDVVHLFNDAAQAAGGAVRCEGADQPLPPVLIDKVRLQQVLMNIVGNAVKFAGGGEVVVRLTQTSTADPDLFRLRFEIADTGPGMPEEVAAHVFDRFYQGDMRSTRRQGGSGLGLAICQALVSLMGGEIGVTSQLGAGSTFWFELPASRAQVEAASPETSTVPNAEGPLHVLAVEDNPTNRLILQRLLDTMGVEVVMAEDGRQGVLAAELQPFDAILMDIQMPEMDGVEATRTIRAGAGINRSTPIIGVTANVLDTQIEAYRAAGMTEVVSKPINPAQLFSALSAVRRHADTAAA
jgi:signal transduction histidine kinase/CheY-like chemotaxis protein